MIALSDNGMLARAAGEKSLVRENMTAIAKTIAPKRKPRQNTAHPLLNHIKQYAKREANITRKNNACLWVRKYQNAKDDLSS